MGNPELGGLWPDPGQVSVGKTSASKQFQDASLTYQVLSKPGGIHVSWDKPERSLMTGRAATGVYGAQVIAQ
jgi:hypothetical protein